MPKRKTKKRINWILLLILIIVPITGVLLLINKVGWLEFVAGLCIIWLLFFTLKLVSRRRRHALLMEKYGDEKLVHELENGYFWQGQTAEQLRDALGEPEDIDEKVLKTKVKSVWKYNHLGGNRYGLRINLDNAVVTGWDQKD